MCGRRRHGRWEDSFNMRESMQQAGVVSPTVSHTRAHGMGYRSVSDLQRRPGKILGSCGQCERVFAAMGHVRRSRKRQTVRLRSIGRSALVFQHKQSDIFKKLPFNVVSGDKTFLP